MNIDVFNGDADGICSLQQLRLASPATSTLISGVKRDIKLLEQVNKLANLDQAKITVLDISMTSNKAALADILQTKAQVFYADHHKTDGIPANKNLIAHIDPNPTTCTALIINNLLKGKYSGWAIAAAFGDNLHGPAIELGKKENFSVEEIDKLRELGELLNYNGYGKNRTDLHFQPEELYQGLSSYQNPMNFQQDSEVLLVLKQGFVDDMTKARKSRVEVEKKSGRIFIMPDQSWARRSAGVFANELARARPDQAHALLTTSGSDNFVVSVRAPINKRTGAVELCSTFATGGGRSAAAGINALPKNNLPNFTEAFFKQFAL